MADKDFRTNEAITAREVRLIDENGEQLGVVPTQEALRRAREKGLDLVEVAPQAKPPVCKILDYGKYKFEQEKKLKETKKKQKQNKLKEVRMQPKIDSHDLEFKTRHIREFLEEGNKVKVTIRFRGRELAHTEIGRGVLEKILELLEDGYTVEKTPSMEGRFMSMVLAPKSKK
ncbi:translation initiation factor IF-3 [Spirochaeta thermophila]|uniref:Translation initiation factor IF-3 n=2 Tax=Winmispira thermophila TaxID=154 RepID=G0GFV6_WINT7|nr:translation initiation factor IF-3 [Spirochaeta thermophila]ADN01732.1 translation initiation factor IF-3 [Spirochaeta thermophila DSM 6192]AEJ61649.1 Translation initiation factor IF-3 [Spirochaeta thermophila DSM 6578]